MISMEMCNHLILFSLLSKVVASRFQLLDYLNILHLNAAQYSRDFTILQNFTAAIVVAKMLE